MLGTWCVFSAEDGKISWIKTLSRNIMSIKKECKKKIIVVKIQNFLLNIIIMDMMHNDYIIMMYKQEKRRDPMDIYILHTFDSHRCLTARTHYGGSFFLRTLFLECHRSNTL